VRKHTAAAMVRSAFTAPHVTEFLTVDVTATMDLVRSIRDDRDLRGHHVTPLAVVAKAVCIAARRTPEVNSRWDEEAGEIVRYDGLNLGIAVATERGLMVPNVRRADRMDLLELADAIGALAETARAGRTSPAELSGGTLSITNIGVFGIDAGTPILNPGEAAILATGAVRRQPWEHHGEIGLRELMTLSLSFDHRLVDGQQGSRFLADVGAILRDPGRALLMT
jgi:pyruvate dehydrogenase E2 component (dihydrolipoamide acetyltransferase)